MRISESDHLKIKRIANRLGVRDSDMYRYAIKTVLSKLSPLDHKNRSGSEVLPAFIECGKELSSFFNLDAENKIVRNPCFFANFNGHTLSFLLNSWLK